MKKWWMSYALRRRHDETRFGTSVWKGEHPLQKIARWSNQSHETSVALLAFGELAEGEGPDEFCTET